MKKPVFGATRVPTAQAVPTPTRVATASTVPTPKQVPTVTIEPPESTKSARGVYVDVESPVLSKALEAAHAERARRKLAGETLVRKNPLEKHFAKPTSLRHAVSAKCFTCQGEDQDPGVRQRIGACNVTKCALHTVRPYQKDDNDDDEG